MRKQGSILRIFCALAVLTLTIVSTSAAAFESSDTLYSNREKLVTQQVDLLKNRLLQAQAQKAALEEQIQTGLTVDAGNANRQLRAQSTLDISVAKSNLESAGIELSESQQTVTRLEKEIQEIENQLNVYDIFGVKIARNEAFNIRSLKIELAHQEKLLELEKSRGKDLLKLQDYAAGILQLQKTRYSRINELLKSQTLVQLKEQQAKSEVTFQQQQSYWLQHLNALYNQQAALASGPPPADSVKTNLQSAIFYANENLNFTYIEMLIVRYQDQLQQLRIAISHSTSITLLNKANDQVQQLVKQVSRLNELLKTRIGILENQKTFLADEKLSPVDTKESLGNFNKLTLQYKNAAAKIETLNQKLISFRSTLDQALQYELSSRQGLPGFSTQAWMDLGAGIWLVPTLAFQVVKSLIFAVASAMQAIDYESGLLLILFEVGLILVYVSTNKFLLRRVSSMAEQELGHVNLKRLSIQILRRNLLDIFIIGDISAIFYFCNIPAQSSSFLINLALVWLFFKVINTIARICLVETVHDSAGHDVRLYLRLKGSFLIGGVVTALTIFMHQLPVSYEVKDLFDRLFLLFLLMVSVFLLRSWEVLPALITAHIDEKRPYLKKVVSLLGLLIPLILLVNSAIGLFGFVNLVLTISWYQSIFVCVLVGYLIIRGLMIEGMMALSTLIIRHVGNGWLWTEAFLKPIDRVLRMILLLGAGVVLFLCYGWNQQSIVVARLYTILNYHLVDMLNTSITLLSLIELVAVASFLFWAARWAREFVFRALASRTNDMGLRNSIAIFSQYTVITVGIFICLQMLGIDFHALAIVMTGFVVAVGFGLRDIANNFVCGFLLLIERPIRVGDIVSVNEHEGEVTHIGGRAVTIRTWDHMDVLVPNADIFSKACVNWTAKDYVIRTVLTIKINRHDSPHDVQALVHKVLSEHKEVLSDPAPEVLLKDLDDSLIEFQIRYFLNLRQVKSRLVLRSEVLLAIWDAFEKEGIKPPYPHHEVHFRNDIPTLGDGYRKPALISNEIEKN